MAGWPDAFGSSLTCSTGTILQESHTRSPNQGHCPSRAFCLNPPPKSFNPPSLRVSVGHGAIPITAIVARPIGLRVFPVVGFNGFKPRPSTILQQRWEPSEELLHPRFPPCVWCPEDHSRPSRVVKASRQRSRAGTSPFGIVTLRFPSSLYLFTMARRYAASCLGIGSSFMWG